MCRDVRRTGILVGARDFAVQGIYRYKEWGNMRCFGNPIVCCFTFVIYFFIV